MWELNSGTFNMKYKDANEGGEEKTDKIYCDILNIIGQNYINQQMYV